MVGGTPAARAPNQATGGGVPAAQPGHFEHADLPARRCAWRTRPPPGAVPRLPGGPGDPCSNPGGRRGQAVAHRLARGLRRP
eukprot:11215067-Lingulodinium_polyedra.AAC.1